MGSERPEHPVSSSGTSMYTCTWSTHRLAHTYLCPHTHTQTHTRGRKEYKKERESCFLAYETRIVLYGGWELRNKGRHTVVVLGVAAHTPAAQCSPPVPSPLPFLSPLGQHPDLCLFFWYTPGGYLRPTVDVNTLT